MGGDGSREEINARRTRGPRTVYTRTALYALEVYVIQARVWGVHAATRVAGIINGKEAFTPRARHPGQK